MSTFPASAGSPAATSAAIADPPEVALTSSSAGAAALSAGPEPVGAQPGAALPQLEPGLDFLQPPRGPEPASLLRPVDEREQVQVPDPQHRPHPAELDVVPAGAGVAGAPVQQVPAHVVDMHDRGPRRHLDAARVEPDHHLRPVRLPG